MMYLKSILLSTLLIFFFQQSKAQINQPFFHFQAVARDHFDHPLVLKNIKIKVALKAATSSDILYEELHEQRTDETGIFSIQIGRGEYNKGLFHAINEINWSAELYQVQLAILLIPENGTSIINEDWISLGATTLGVVPYAMHAFNGGTNILDTASLNRKLNNADTTAMLLPYALKSNLQQLQNTTAGLLKYSDTTHLLGPYVKKSDSVQTFVTPHMLQSYHIDTSFMYNAIQARLKLADTAAILNGYLRVSNYTPFSGSYLDLTNKPVLFDGNYTNLTNKPVLFDGNYASLTNQPSLFSGSYVDLTNKPILFDGNYNSLTNKPILFDGNYNSLNNLPDLSTKENLSNKSLDITNDANSNTKYPSVNAVKTYVDATVLAGAPDADNLTKGIVRLAGDLAGTALSPSIANNTISTAKLQDASVTDAKLASGISASKVGLGNLTNNAQIYNLNGLTAQVQNFASPGTSGIAPNWSSVGANHTLHIPMASASSVTAGLISNTDYTHFNDAYNNSITSLTNTGNRGAATLVSNVLNIPNYSLVGLAGNINANTVFAGPVSGGVGAAGFRTLVSNDIPNNAANTTGNAATATALLNARNINNTLFDGSADITITANTSNALSFANDGLGVNAGTSFNGAVAKTISYNSIGASPLAGSASLNTVGTINTGTWAANVIGANYGGAGTNNGLLKADGNGLVSTAVSGTDYIAPFGAQTAKYFYAAPNNINGNPVFRTILASDIPTLNQSTTGNAATATTLQNTVNINGVGFNGSTDITISANTNNSLSFNTAGTGASAPTSFNGSVAKTISYNTIGAAPSIGSTNITTLGTISTGTWSATVIGANYGGAGNNNGILKADGTGVVSTATAGTDYQVPLSFTSPLVNTSNTIAMSVADASHNGYLSSTDWNSFNNKIDQSEKGAQNGVATLDASGKVPTSQIPSISFSSGYVVTSQSAMLGLSSAVVGSIAIRTDNSKNYVLSGLPASNLSNWLELLMPANVTSVNGYAQSNITLTTSDINEGTNLYFTNARVKNLLSATAPLSYSASTGVFSISSASTNTDGYLSASDWNTFNNKIGAFTSQAANTFYAGPSSGANASPSFRTIASSDIPTLNQSTTGNAATATKLAATKNINGVAFDGSADITITAGVPNAITFNNSGLGGISTTSFDGTVAKTISYNTIGASPLAGSASLTTVGTIATGVWSASTIDANHGGAGSVNGILKADGSGNVSAAVAGTDFQSPFGAQTAKYFYAAPNASTGNPIFRAILASDIPTLNQSTTGNAATATTLQTARTINGVNFDGSSNIIISSNITNAITFDNSGAGVASGNTFNGAVAKTISYNTIGASPLAGSTSLTTLGTITSGTWSGTVIDANHGGAGNISGILKANGTGVVTAATAGTDFENPLSFSTPLVRTTNTISIPSASASNNGYLSAVDFNTFNNKQVTMVAGTGVSITGGNTINIGQSVATSASPSFTGMTVSGLNVAGVVTNSAAGVLSTSSTTGTGNFVRASSPSLVTPSIGDATASSINVSGDITAKRYKLTMPLSITAAATTSIDLSTGNVFTVNLGLNVTTLSLTNPVVGTYLIKFVQDATGTRDVTFPAAWKWAGGTAPNLTNTANKIDIVTLIYDGTTYYATIVQNF